MIGSENLTAQKQKLTLLLTLPEQEELTELRDDRGLRLRFSNLPLESFWLKTSNEFSNLAYRAILILLPFSTSYLCESSFSAMIAIKDKKRKTLRAIDEELRVSLSSVPA